MDRLLLSLQLAGCLDHRGLASQPRRADIYSTGLPELEDLVMSVILRKEYSQLTRRDLTFGWILDFQQPLGDTVTGGLPHDCGRVGMGH